ncbi:MAG: addiction module toxin RelE [Candidatus Nanoarchaeia archaeon]|nr:addiction module toxin RelE [Candidatus Nanoarchaeia archaeon]
MKKFKISEPLQRKIKKLQKKDKVAYMLLMKKIEQILDLDIIHYKNLKYDLNEFKRVHIGPFVLVFRYDEKDNIIYFEDFDHHDKIYEK